MSSRDSILKAIAANKPALKPLPDMDLEAVIRYDDPVAQFTSVLQTIGGAVVSLDNLEGLKAELSEERAKGNFVINTVEALGMTNQNIPHLQAAQLASLHKTYLKGTLAVAENGAIWLYEHQMVNRLIPFICEWLVIVIDQKDIVPTMHHAMQKIEMAKEGFGLFLAGPSKTADIEQSLVIGAHGARGLTVYIV